MNQRLERLDHLAGFLREPAKAFVQAAKTDLNLTLCIVFTWRSAIDQLKIYAQGRQYDREQGIWVLVNDKERVTNALPGHSPHNVITVAKEEPASLAFDAVPMSKAGELLWNTPRPVWEKLWALAWKFGFDPLGDKIGGYFERDLCHFEEPAWKLKLTGFGLKQPSADAARLV